MLELPEITIVSDGSSLCKDALAVMQRAAGARAGKVVEAALTDFPRARAAELGLRATPSIVFNDMIATVGVPTDEEAAGLIKRAEIDRVILRYAIPKSAAIQSFAAGKIPREATARAIAGEFFPFSEEFPLFLSAAISHVRDEPARMLLVHNLYEEHGNLAGADRMHPALFRAFCRGVGLTTEKLEGQGPLAPGVQAAHMVMEICRRGPATRAVAALYPIELMFGPTCDIVISGLKHLHLSPDAMDYWFIHSSSGVELEHAEQMRQALFRSCKTEADWEEAVGVAEDVAQTFFELFDHIASATLPTTDEQLAVFDAVQKMCDGSPGLAEHPISHSSAAYYMSLNLNRRGHWFLRTLGDTERRSLVSRLPVEKAKQLAPGFHVEAAPRVFGHSRIFYDGAGQLPKLKELVRAAYQEERRQLAS